MAALLRLHGVRGPVAERAAPRGVHGQALDELEATFHEGHDEGDTANREEAEPKPKVQADAKATSRQRGSSRRRGASRCAGTRAQPQGLPRLRTDVEPGQPRRESRVPERPRAELPLGPAQIVANPSPFGYITLTGNVATLVARVSTDMSEPTEQGREPLDPTAPPQGGRVGIAYAAVSGRWLQGSSTSPHFHWPEQFSSSRPSHS